MRGKIKPTSKIAGWHWCRSQMMKFKAARGKRSKEISFQFLIQPAPLCGTQMAKIYLLAGWLVRWIS
jgi:hypothetical protein